jgi:hypothetical protein
MRPAAVFTAGRFAGTVAVWLCSKEIQDVLRAKTREARIYAIDTLLAPVEERDRAAFDVAARAFGIPDGEFDTAWVYTIGNGAKDRLDGSGAAPRTARDTGRRRRPRSPSSASDRHRLCGFAGGCPGVVGAVGLREARRNLLPMEELAHNAVRHRPVVAVHAVVMRAQSSVA